MAIELEQLNFGHGLGHTWFFFPQFRATCKTTEFIESWRCWIIFAR